jgi:signal transduction histidine kinase
MVRPPVGPPRLLAGTAAPIRGSDGRVAGAILITRDETERVRLEEELRESVALRERFLAIIGHDLRSPLNAVQLTAQSLLRQGAQPGETQTALKRILTSVGRMDRMIRDLLDFARAHGGMGMPMEPRPIDLGATVRVVVEELQASHPGRKLALAVEGDGAGSWDPDRITQLVTNIVVNALQHGAPDRPVEIGVRGGPATVHLAVRNFGPVIPEAVREHIFEPFRQGSPESVAPGLGLGLYIVKLIATAHGGNVSVASSAEAGTTFAVDLPR